MIAHSNYYQDTEYLSNTMLGYLERSPEHFYQYREGTIKIASEALSFGTSYHCAILEPEKFKNNYIVKPPGLRRGTKPYEEFVKKAEGKNLISTPDYDKVCEMREKLATYKDIWNMLHQGEQEKIFTWENKGIKCKGLIDNYHDNRIIDLKTTQDCAPDHWGNTAKHFYSYDRQAAWYTDGVHLKTGDIPEFWFVVQEKDPPYLVAVYECTKEFISSGRRKYVQLLEQYRKLFVDNKYPPGQPILGQLM